MDIRLLGPLSIRIGDNTVIPTARKPRQLLCLLLLNPNQVMPVSYLVHGLWDDNPPASALATLQTYVLQLRKQLDTALSDSATGSRAKNILTTRDGAYMFVVDDGELDWQCFRRYSREGARALKVGDNLEAARLLSLALSLWQGEPLADVRLTQVLEGEVVRLREARLYTLEQRLEADLRLGRHQECLEELALLCERYPLHENFYHQYMLALYWSGRRLEALDVFRRLRSTLVDDLGLEPAPNLQKLQHAILASEPIPLP